MSDTKFKIKIDGKAIGMDDLDSGEPVFVVQAAEYGALEAAIAYHDTLAAKGASADAVAAAYAEVLAIRDWRLANPVKCNEFGNKVLKRG